MAEEKRGDEEEIEQILSDMDAILSGAELPLPPQEPAPEPPAPSRPPAPPPVAALPAAEPLADVAVPEKAGKDQIRRVAFIYLARYAQERDAFGKALDQAAATISKKPLFLKTVLLQPVALEHSPADVLARLQETGAVAALALLEGMPEGRLKEYGEVLSAGGVMFRLVAPGEAQKRSLAVDIVVDMMLLPHES